MNGYASLTLAHWIEFALPAVIRRLTSAAGVEGGLFGKDFPCLPGRPDLPDHRDEPRHIRIFVVEPACTVHGIIIAVRAHTGAPIGSDVLSTDENPSGSCRAYRKS